MKSMLVRAALAGALCLLLGPGWAPGQTEEDEDLSIVFDGIVPEPPAVAPIPSPRPTSSASTNAAAKSPDQKRLQELLALKFDRSASSILSAMADRLQGAATTNEVEAFQQSIVVGDWSAAGQFLRRLPADHGKQVYRSVLRELPNAARPSSSRSMPGPPSGPQPPAIAGSSPALLPVDVIGLAEMAPHDLEEEDVRSLGQLLARLLGRGDAIEPFLAKLESGTARLGGDDPANRRRAADLLVAANRLIEAGRFLPPLEKARESQDWSMLDLRARQRLEAGKKEQDAKALREAWDLNQIILSAPNAGASNREPALRRSFELIPLLSGGVGTNWLRQTFQESPREGLILLSALSEHGQQSSNPRLIDQRRKNLELQKQVVEMLLSVADPAQTHWRSALNLLALGWAAEAAYARQRHQPRRNQGPQYDPYGNLIYYESPPQVQHDGNQVSPLPVDQVLASAPGPVWLEQLDDSLRLALFDLIADLHLKAEEPEKALGFVEKLASGQARTAAERASQFLRVWASTRNPVQQHPQRYGPYGPVYYGPGSPYGLRGGGVALTRAMQNRNMGELSTLLRRLESLNLPKLDHEAVLAAFTSAHSPAEVFKTEDIQTVFGSIERMKLETLASLAQTMRERLAGQWRQSRVQQENKTQRNDKQIESEVLRGYEVVLKLVEDGLKRTPDHWRLNLARAAALFDLAEFQYGKKVDLAIYVDKREDAFRSFERAAELYAQALPALEEKDQSPLVYQQWFNANLGASDLAYVTRQQEPASHQLDRVRSAILRLPGDAAERHMASFAKGLGDSANTLRPELKPRYLRAGLRVVSEHPGAEQARKLVTYYDDLLGEIDLVVGVDGDATIGHSQPFGVLVSLRHTADIEREAGGFARYLRNQKRTPYYSYNPYGMPQRNFIEEFDQQVREKLVDHFEIKSITFLDEKTESRGYGRPGWRQTPLAYLLLQAKDGAVDRLPALQMDLDFIDQRGAVVLPVESKVVLLDARPERVPPRPISSLEVTQILDDREAHLGRLTLEIKASGHGLVPELSQLVRTNLSGLIIEDLADHGLAIAKIDTESEAVPISERNWFFKLRVPDQASDRLLFQYPEAAQRDIKMVFKRYADADLIEVEPKLALAGFNLRPRPIWPWFAFGVVALLVGGAAAWWGRSHRRPDQAVVSPYLFPENPTPFAVIGLLRRMNSDASLPWNETDRLELRRTIQRLEAHFFSRDRNGDPAPDLEGIGRRWVRLARQDG